MKEYVCIDIGGTAIKYGVLNENAEFLTSDECATHAKKGGKHILNKIKDIISDLLEKFNPSGICISTAGMVDCEKGSILYASDLIPEYTGTEIKKEIEQKFNIPCEVENDVNCAGLAEYYNGASKGSKISVCMTVGTGIGGALIIDGKIVHGFCGSACEIGYMHLKNGIFQEMGASSVLVRKVADTKKMKHEDVNGKYVFEQAKQGDKDCISAIDEMIDVLCMGISNVCYVVNPEVIVLGGGIMAEKEYLECKIKENIKKYLNTYIEKNTRIEFAQNRNNAGMLGAYYNFKSRNNAL